MAYALGEFFAESEAFSVAEGKQSFGPYMLLSPTYVNILNVYAFSNLDDVSDPAACNRN